MFLEFIIAAGKNKRYDDSEEFLYDPPRTQRVHTEELKR
jgi:hypothetical protein